MQCRILSCHGVLLMLAGVLVCLTSAWAQPANDDFESASREKRFRDALHALLELAEPIDAFFDRVMVMADDEKLKVNRLNLLGTITGLFLSIADFSRLEVG